MNNFCPLFPQILWKIGYRYLARYRWQSVLMILGITLGVAVMVSIDLAVASASRAFDLSKESLVGRTTHQIIASANGIDETIFTQLQLTGIDVLSTPIISQYVASPQLGNVPIELIGLDPFRDHAFRGFFSNHLLTYNNLEVFLTQPGAIVISDTLANRYQLTLGNSISLDINGKIQNAFVAGILSTEDGLTETALEGIVLADISTAQELTGKIGKIDRIDLIIPREKPQIVDEIQAFLPPEYRILPVENQSNTLQAMTNAFNINLQALSLLAFVVGLFLIYNTMTFSVVRRRSLFGMLRCLGYCRREIFWMVITEAGIVGVIGTGIGIGLGILMGKQTIQMVSQTINDLYYTTTVRSVTIPIISLMKGGIVGILATVLTAAFPAWEASSIPPKSALSRSGLEFKAARVVWWTVPGGLSLILIGYLIFRLPSTSIILGFVGTFFVVIGFAMLSAMSMVWLMKLNAPILRHLFGLIGRMAPRNLVNSLSRTSVAIAALMLSIAVVIGMSLMIGSFRHTVTLWLDYTLNGDIYISAPSFIATTPTEAIDPVIIQRIETNPLFQSIYYLRATTVDAEDGLIRLSASSNPLISRERFLLSSSGDPQTIQKAMDSGSVLLSESLSFRLGLQTGDSIRLRTKQGWHDFPVVGIFVDYSSAEGHVLMRLPVFRQYWEDNTITAIDIRLKPGISIEQGTESVRSSLAGLQRVVIRPNMVLRGQVLEVFDRTFAITNSLRILATIVAFMGVLNALLLLQMEKQREMGILRTLGLTGNQLWKLAMLETGLMGLTAGILAIPTGFALTWILIQVINRRSFGWSMQLDVDLMVLVQAVVIAVIAALLAGIYPAWRLSQMTAAEAIRYE